MNQLNHFLFLFLAMSWMKNLLITFFAKGIFKYQKDLASLHRHLAKH